MTTSHENLSKQYSSKPEGYYGFSRPEILPFVPGRCKRILEVGCSSGAFGTLVKESIPGCIVWGIEPDSNAAAIASTRLDRVINGVFSADVPELSGQTFDAICFNDVLEHLANPEKALLECKTLLAENGAVIASLPNILFFYQISKILIEQDWKYEDAGIMDNTHLRFFTKKSIVRMFESAGYNVNKIEGINASYGFKFKVANFLTAGWLTDWKYVQFAVQAQPSNHLREFRK
jgi:2-polyprenyl-3-methyl-5-hydroxy-6-metoxy-1,4-benzoquinol methylase